MPRPHPHTSSLAVLASSCTVQEGRWGWAVETATVEMGREPQDQAWQFPGGTETKRPNRKRRGQANDRDSPACCCCGYPLPPSFWTRGLNEQKTLRRHPQGDRSARERPAACLYRPAAFPRQPSRNSLLIGQKSLRLLGGQANRQPAHDLKSRSKEREAARS